jgi:hypothetical protein
LISGQGQGLLAVVVGVAIALSAQQVIRYFRKADDRARRLKQECVDILTLSEELQDRVTADASTADDVASWDIRAYRRARARLRHLDPPASILAALADLDESRADLMLAYRFSAAQAPGNHPSGGQWKLAEAVRAHAEALDHFATSGSVLVRIS